MIAAFHIIQIIVSIALIILVLLQVKGSGLGDIFGGSGGVYRTRRGVEKTLFYIAIGLSVLFFILTLVTVYISQ